MAGGSFIKALKRGLPSRLRRRIGNNHRLKTGRLRQRAKMALETGEFEAAVGICSGLLIDDPADRGAERMIYRAFLSSKDPDFAERHVEELARRLPDPPTSTALMARLFLMIERFEEARQLADRAIAGDPDLADPVHTKATVLARCGKIGEANNLLDGFQQAHPGNTRAMLLSAQFAGLVGDLPKSRRFYRLLLENDPDDINASRNLLVLEYNLGNDGSAREILDNLDLDRLSGEAKLFDFACFFLREGYTGQAGSLLDKALATGEFSVRIASLAVAVALAQGTQDDASRHWEHLQREAPGDGRQVLLLSLLEPPDTAQIAGLDVGLARQTLLDAAPASPLAGEFADMRRTLHDIRRTEPSRHLLSAQPDTISILTPIHRKRDLDNAVAQVARQTWRNAEALFAINSAEITAEDIRARWRSHIPLRVIDATHASTLGGVLNHAISQARGDVLMRFDADDLYLPEYCADMIVSMRHFSADVAGKKQVFRLFKRCRAVFYPDEPDLPFQPVEWNAVAGGGTLAFTRQVAEAVNFHENSSLAEDEVFIRTCTMAGFAFYNLDPFNYVNVRSADLTHHTWRMGELEMLFRQPNHLICDEADLDRYIAD